VGGAGGAAGSALQLAQRTLPASSAGEKRARLARLPFPVCSAGSAAGRCWPRRCTGAAPRRCPVTHPHLLSRSGGGAPAQARAAPRSWRGWSPAPGGSCPGAGPGQENSPLHSSCPAAAAAAARRQRGPGPRRGRGNGRRRAGHCVLRRRSRLLDGRVRTRNNYTGPAPADAAAQLAWSSWAAWHAVSRH
jgi:hypothetical protein